MLFLFFCGYFRSTSRGNQSSISGPTRTSSDNESDVVGSEIIMRPEGVKESDNVCHYIPFDSNDASSL